MLGTEHCSVRLARHWPELSQPPAPLPACHNEPHGRSLHRIVTVISVTKIEGHKEQSYDRIVQNDQDAQNVQPQTMRVRKMSRALDERRV